MKAVIMAGGEGSRLRPLTCDRPKPMVPLLNKPTMEHIVNLLKKHGITDIGVTLQYMPQAIMDHFGDGSEFGVNLQYFIEKEPLGTAGSVKNGEEFLDETFLVISGDALTDFDLQKAIDYHREKKALATLVLTTVDNPLEYGVVITEKTGEISRFLEKPSWGEVFSDTVNTGIYILEPQVLAEFPAEKKYDFSQDLFPKLLKEEKPMYGCVLDGYWCDIGNLQQYQQAHFDILDRKVQIEFTAKEFRPGIWLEEGVEINPEAIVEAPAYIGAGTKINQGAVIGSHSVLGKNNLISSKVSTKRSILWDNNYLGTGSQVRGATLCHKVQVKNLGNLFEGVVVGDSSVIEEGANLRPGVKLWPYKRVDAGATVNDSLIWGAKAIKNIFGSQGIRGILNLDITPEYAVKLGAAFGSMFADKGKIVLSSDNWSGANVVKQSFLAGLMASGTKVTDIGAGVTPINRYAIKSLQAAGGIHVKQCPEDLSKVSIQFFNDKGINISKGEERKLENLLTREDFKRNSQVGEVENLDYIYSDYCNDIGQRCFPKGKLTGNYNILVGYQGQAIGNLLKSILSDAGCNVIFSDYAANSFNKLQAREVLKTFGNSVKFHKADCGVFVDNNGENIVMVDELGEMIGEEELFAINSLLTMENEPGGHIAAPTTASSVIETLAERFNCSVQRSKTAPQHLMDSMNDFQFELSFDGIYNLASLLKYVTDNGMTFSQLKGKIPQFHTYQQEIYCPWEDKGKVIRRLIEDSQGQKVEMLDGVKVFHDGGWSLILPDSEKPMVKVFSEALSLQEAKLINEIYCDKIETLKA